MNFKLSAASALAAALLAVPGFAHPHEEGEKVIERVIIVEKDGEGRLGEASALRRRGLAAGEHRLMLRGCEGGDRTEVEGGTEKEKARIVLCTKGKLTGEERAKRLEALRTRLASRDHLSPEAKAKIEAAIQQAIARARAGN